MWFYTKVCDSFIILSSPLYNAHITDFDNSVIYYNYLLYT